MSEEKQEGKKKWKKLKFRDDDGNKTLDTLKNLNISTFDTVHQVDPLFRKTTQMFDEMSIGTLMTS